jgi:hypothetical protein
MAKRDDLDVSNRFRLLIVLKIIYVVLLYPGRIDHSVSFAPPIYRTEDPGMT